MVSVAKQRTQAQSQVHTWQLHLLCILLACSKKAKHIHLSLAANELSECVSPTFAKVWTVFTVTTAQLTHDSMRSHNPKYLVS